MIDFHANERLGERSYGPLLWSVFWWEVVGFGVFLGATVFAVNCFDLSAATMICVVIAVSTTCLCGVLAHGFSSVNSQIHGSSEFVLGSLHQVLSRTSDS